MSKRDAARLLANDSLRDQFEVEPKAFVTEMV